MKNYIKNCPNCKKEIIYHKKDRWENACVKNKPCSDCLKQRVWQRNCPKCNELLSYYKKHHFDDAQKLGRKCKSCSKKGLIAEKNPFFGKNHTEATKNKISEKNRNKIHVRSNESLQKASDLASGSNNPMFGKSLYDFWIEKHGIDEANIRFAKLREKRSINASGPNNPMFGQPSPQGSGNGWSGWYKNVFFRSIRELSYIILYLEKENKTWQSAECIKIPYEDWDGKRRNYHPDFLVDNKQIIEVKPLKLHNSPSVQLKVNAANKYCEDNDLLFLIIDPIILTSDQIKILYDAKEISFTKKYEERYKNDYGIID